jgi:hypothetical protein
MGVASVTDPIAVIDVDTDVTGLIALCTRRIYNLDV